MQNPGEVFGFISSNARLGYEIIVSSYSLPVVDDCLGTSLLLFRLFCGLCPLIGIQLVLLCIRYCGILWIPSLRFIWV